MWCHNNHVINCRTVWWFAFLSCGFCRVFYLCSKSCPAELFWILKIISFILLLFRKIKHNLIKMCPLFLNTILDWETSLVVFAPLPQWFLNLKVWKVQYSWMLIWYVLKPVSYGFSPVCDVWSSVSICWDELHSSKCFAVLNCALK